MGDPEQKRRRYCLMCHVFKPERCHHCSACGRCVLNMDHHCPWINNCVGFYNRKHFMLLLIYVLLSAYLVAGAMLFPVKDTLLQLYEHPSLQNLDPFLQVGAFVLDAMLAGVITMFFKFHLSLVLTNSTTIETMDKTIQKKGEYRRSAKHNWAQVFGLNPWLWAFPMTGRSGRPLGDGVVWRPDTAHQDEEIPNNEGDRKASTLSVSKATPSKVLASPVDEPLRDTAPVKRVLSP